MWTKILLLCLVFSFLFSTDLSFDQDLGRHLKLGEIIVNTRTVPKTNLFSYTNPDFPFINTHWLFEVFAFLTSQTIGLQALLIIKIIIFLLSVWIIFQIIPKENTVLLLPIGFIFLHVLRERLALRPEIFSFLFTAITYFILDKFLKQKTKFIFLLPVIQFIWINTHIYFFVGLILQAIYLIELIYQKLRNQIMSRKLALLTIIFGLSIVLSSINPNGLKGLLYPLNVTKNYGYTIVENQTMFLLESINFKDPNFIFVKLSLGIIFLSFIAAFITRKITLKNILLAGTGVGLSLLNVRGFPYLIFLSLPATLSNLGHIKKNNLFRMLATFTVLLLFIESFSYFSSKPELKFVENGKEALDFVLANNLPNPIFNNFDIGSYIVYRGYPKYKVFVDGRPEAYPSKFFTNLYIPVQSDYPKFKELEKKAGFKTIIFSITDQTPWGRNFLHSVVQDKDWKTVYIDNFMIVLVRVQ